MSVKFSNNAVTTLSADISAGATSFTVASATPFPTLASGDWTYVSLTSEVVKIDTISGNTFELFENDTVQSPHTSGESVELRMTAELLNDFAEDTESLPLAGGTMTGDVSLGDNVKAKFGAGNDLQIYHDGSNSIVDDVGDGDLILKGSSKVKILGSNSETMASFSKNGAVSLFYDSGTYATAKLATTSTGVDVTGKVNGLEINTTATSNLGLGTGAVDAITTGDYNVGVGDNALTANTTGNSNTANGFYALRFNTTGNNNTASGRNALYNNTTGASNTANGYQALTENTTGNNNTASGYRSLYANTTGANNVASGYQALNANTTGSSNDANGYWALNANTTGSENTAIGSLSLANNTTGSKNSAVGEASLYSNTTGDNNTTAGKNSLRNNTSGYRNTASGGNSLYANTTGYNNTASGYDSFSGVTTGYNNSGLGRWSGTSNSPSGNVTTGSNIICLGDSAITALYCADTSISSSDGRDKTDVEDFTAGLDFITQMRPVTYRWDKRTSYLTKENQDPLSIVPDGTHKKPKQHIGFISQEVQALEQALGFATDKDNELICNTNEDATAMGLKYERLVPILVNAIKELSAKVEALENA